MLTHQAVRTERQWKSSTGLTQTQFLQLTRYFEETYVFFNGVSLEKSAQRLNVALLLPTYEDCLFFVLFQLKNSLSYDNLGLLIETDGGNAQRNFEQHLKILSLTLERQGVMPRRNFNDLADFQAHLQDEEEIIFDASEQATQRPQEHDRQEEFYSGKKNDILTKN
jgi:hypothetical protein